MKDRTFRRWIYITLLIAALMRIGFLAVGNGLPVMWDARRYAGAGIALLSYIDDSSPIVRVDTQSDSEAFQHYYNKYIEGEQIDWLFYAPSTLTQARDDLYFSGPLYPLFLSIVFFLAPVADFTFARLLGIGFDVLAALLLMLIAMRLVGRKAAVISGLIYAVYFPFVLTSNMLLLETPTSCLILAGIYALMRGVETNRGRFFVKSGIICGLLILLKPTAMLLAVPFIVGLFFYARKEWALGQFVRPVAAFAIPAFVIFLVWLGITSARYDQLTLRDPAYAGANLRQSSSVTYEGYDLDAVEADFWNRSVYGDLLSNPLAYAGLFAKKFERLWSRPYNDFKRRFLLPYRAGEWLHTTLVTLGMIGLLLLLARHPGRAAWPLLIVIYYIAIHLVFHSINRYSFNALPMLFLGAGYVLVAMVEAIGAGRRSLLLALAALLAGWWLCPDVINAVSGTGLTKGLVVAVLALKTALWILGLTLLVRELLPAREARFRWLLPVLGGLILTVVAWTPVMSRNAWAEFSTRLDDPTIRAGTRIYMAPGQLPPEIDDGDAMLAALIDLNSPSGRKNTFTVHVGNTRQEFVGGKQPLLKYFYPKPAYDAYARLESLGLEHYRQYAVIPVADSLVRGALERDGYIDIAVAINDSFREANNYVTVYGNFEADPVFIPSVDAVTIERYVHRGDPRIRLAAEILSDSAFSYYIGRDDTGPSVSVDLSPAAGRQSGRYNMFLVYFRGGEKHLVY